MPRRNVLIVALSVVAVCGLVLVLVLLSRPAPVAAHSSYTWKPGCHCGAPKTTITTKKPTTTTTKKKPATTTTKKPATTTTKAALQASTTIAVEASTTTASSQTTTTATTVPTPSTDQNDGIGIAAAAAGLFDSGGDPPGGSGPDDGPGTDPADGTPTAIDGSPLSMTDVAPQYYVSPVAMVFLLVYGASFLLYKTKRMRVTTHRKIWNVLLMATFLITGIFGLILAIGISRNPPWLIPSSLLFWHVETGMVMCFISFFHLGWHVRYYAKMLIPQRTGRRERTFAERRADLLEDARPLPAIDWSAEEARRLRRADRSRSRGR
jgi:hypothetical protein